MRTTTRSSAVVDAAAVEKGRLGAELPLQLRDLVAATVHDAHAVAGSDGGSDDRREARRLPARARRA